MTTETRRSARSSKGADTESPTVDKLAETTPGDTATPDSAPGAATAPEKKPRRRSTRKSASKTAEPEAAVLDAGSPLPAPEEKPKRTRSTRSRKTSVAATSQVGQPEVKAEQPEQTAAPKKTRRTSKKVKDTDTVATAPVDPVIKAAETSTDPGTSPEMSPVIPVLPALILPKDDVQPLLPGMIPPQAPPEHKHSKKHPKKQVEKPIETTETEDSKTSAPETDTPRNDTPQGQESPAETPKKSSKSRRRRAARKRARENQIPDADPDSPELQQPDPEPVLSQSRPESGSQERQAQQIRKPVNIRPGGALSPAPSATDLMLADVISLLSRASEILSSAELTSGLIDSLLYTDETTGEKSLRFNIPVSGRESLMEAVVLFAKLLNCR